MNRRAAVERISLILGGATLSPQLTAGLMGQVINVGASIAVTEAQQALLAEVADFIIPDTDTPGAKAAGVHQFIVRLMRDCYVLEEQEKFYAGLANIDADSRTANDGKGFVEIDEAGKKAALESTVKNNKDFFKLLKSLTVSGYFTSEIGATQAVAYLPLPGQFLGDVPLKEGQKAWAE
jgi:hypothetical protein